MSIEHRVSASEQQQFTASVVEIAQNMSAYIVSSIAEKCGEPPTEQGKQELAYWSADINFRSPDNPYASRLLEGSVAGSDAFRVEKIGTFFESWDSAPEQRKADTGRYLNMVLDYGDPQRGEELHRADVVVHALTTAQPFLMGRKALDRIHTLQINGKLRADQGEESAELIHVVQADEALSLPGIYWLDYQELQVIASGLAQLRDNVNILDSLEASHGVSIEEERPDEAAWFKAAIDRFKAES